jgi:phosphoserine aminotransferase
MTKKYINFSAGPAVLPNGVLKTIAHELFNWQNTGVSVLEIGHRTREFSDLNDKLEASVRRLLQVPDDFSVLFLPGGAQIQFSVVLMNLLGDKQCANYIDTGYWATSAIKEAQKYTHVHIAASAADTHYTTIPDVDTWDMKQEAAFLHFTDNETIGGVEFQHIPPIDTMPLVSDMSSNIFSRPIDFSRIGCVYACAQKNLGIAGMTLVIVRKDLLGRAHATTPSVFNYAIQDKNKSLLATPPTFAFYVASLVLDWIEAEGGIQAMAQRNALKSSMLYRFIDDSTFYLNPVDKRFRSRMNVPFSLTEEDKEPAFFDEAEKNGFLYLQGHRSVGGARASIYNAISVEEVSRFIDFLRFFAETKENRR